MKIAESRPVFEKLDNTSKDNYRPKSTLSIFSKLFESSLFSQLDGYIQNKFLKYLTGKYLIFRKIIVRRIHT